MGSTPHWGPDEPTYEIFLERTFLVADFLTGIGCGMQFILYISCALYLWNRRNSRGRLSIYLILYITVLLCVQTVFAAVLARTVQVMYIDNRNYPGGPWRYFLTTQYIAINMFYASLLILSALSDLLVLWRCWIIWGGSGTLISYAVIALPFLMVLVSLVMGTLWIMASSGHTVLSTKSVQSMAYGTSYYVLSLSVNILLTILIAARLLVYRREARLTLPPGHAAHYFSLAAIFVESAALYSIPAIAFIVSYTLESPISQSFLSVASSAQQISGYLIVYRLAEGRAWNQGTSANNEVLTTLRFRQSTFGGTTNTASINLETPNHSPPFAPSYSRPNRRTHVTSEEKKDEKEVSIYTWPR